MSNQFLNISVCCLSLAESSCPQNIFCLFVSEMERTNSIPMVEYLQKRLLSECNESKWIKNFPHWLAELNFVEVYQKAKCLWDCCFKGCSRHLGPNSLFLNAVNPKKAMQGLKSWYSLRRNTSNCLNTACSVSWWWTICLYLQHFFPMTRVLAGCGNFR